MVTLVVGLKAPSAPVLPLLNVCAIAPPRLSTRPTTIVASTVISLRIACLLLVSLTER